MTRKIIHIDMDCFFAAVEMRDNPALAHLPVAVGGRPDQRGVISTANYIARRFGVHSAMSSAYARQLCPDLVLVPGNFHKYKAISQGMREIFAQFTDLVEPLSLDEAYLDVTDNNEFKGGATEIAVKIRQQIAAQYYLTASAGVAPNKFLAKVASDWKKPNGQFVIPPAAVANFVKKLPVNKIFGVGKVTAAKMARLGMTTCGDLQQWRLEELTRLFGVFGGRLHQLSRGIDDRPVRKHRVRKSLSVEHTFAQDIIQESFCLEAIERLYQALLRRLDRHMERGIHKQFIKIKFADFHQTTVERVVPKLSLKAFQALFQQGLQRSLTAPAIRLIGLGVRFRDPALATSMQLRFEF